MEKIPVESLTNTYFSNLKEKEQVTVLKSLKESSNVDENAISSFMDLIVCRNHKDSTLPDVYAMTTDFWKKLMKGGYSKVKNMTNDVDIFQKHMLFSK